MALRTTPLTPLLVVTTELPGTIRPVMDTLLRMEEATSEWCPLTDRRVICYLARHAKVLAGTTIEDATWNHEALFYPPVEGERGTRRIAGFPGAAEHVGGKLDGLFLWQHMLQANWGFYCDRVPRRANHRFYVEPVPRWMPDLLAEAGVAHRTLVISRDPRSELAEQWQSGARRGVLPATLNAADTPLSFAEKHATPSVRERLAEFAAIVQATPTRDTLCVRYEDLLEASAATWNRLRDWLESTKQPDPGPPTTGHEWPRSRWRALLPASVIEHYRKVMGRELEALGHAS